jgi:hypothetical protein
MDHVEGFLEVGRNDQGEVVVNHPDLKPGANGVGHIVFSAAQARSFAALLLKHAGPPPVVPDRRTPNSCNRHSDCAAADAKAKAQGARFGASHCNDDECEDCFGC